MNQETLTPAEQALIEKETSWTQERELVRVAPGRKLFRLTGTDGAVWYATLIGDPEPRMVYHEPVRFVVTVHKAKGECRAGHQVGDRWEFDVCTPAGLCGSAYHTMYPVLHALSLSGGQYQGPAAEETLVSCPDEGWLTFRIERRRWTPDLWDADPAAESQSAGA